MKGRDALREILTSGLAVEPGASEASPKRATSGAIKAMNLGLQRLSKDAEEARQLRAQLDQVERVVELDADLIDASIVADRIADAADPDFTQLRASVAEHGQQVPILVRPHPEAPGRYQAAYGHRRLRAAAELGRPVRAIVRALSDRELVIAQGKENNERRDLSFIERALFAASLEERRFDRPTIQAALGVDAPELSRLLSVAGAVSADLIRAIGPAPKVGRPRWLALVELLSQDGAVRRVQGVLASEEFRRAGSDQRFSLVLSGLQAKAAPARSETLRLRGGQTVARIERTGRILRLTSDLPAFQAFLEARLPDLIREFETGRPGDETAPDAARRR
ncbi:plasmid partitioning protein RepB [Methylobacterium nodulans]|uniref:Plasmid partitioning protein RepB n=1 Tax=Methylobacterium nodulans (strain LMG 21967 / CNCM I-2342 / ORS 2060) TaxID=460265 RepID=B8IRA2_METNO|nr:plasmid partitioning protein RepB [Methylobacterium nodulans]ACL58642.1 plasmid partitioning protein RepB [Methylobacterium nodulans ORS 2060]